MTPAEIEKARDLVKIMEEEATANLYFEICGSDARLLSSYIRELEKRVTRSP